MSGAIGWFARNHVAANLLMFLIIVGGLMAIPTIKQEVFPEIRPEIVTVTVPYPGAAPAEVETGICIKIEEEIQDVDGIKKLTSVAAEGFGTVTVELHSGTDVSEALDDTKARVDAIDTFPEDAEEPVIQEVIRQTQVINVVVAGDLDETTLKGVGERVRDEIVSLPGITLAALTIARPYEISIEVSETALRRYQLTFAEVALAVRRSSLDLPGGSVKSQGGEILLRTIGQAYRGTDFESIALRTRPDGTRLTLGDVATVVDGFADTGQSARFDGKPAVMVQVYQVGDQRALDVTAAVKEYVAGARERFPEGVELTTWQDRGELLKSRLNLLIRNGTVGFILVFLILTLFLKLRLAVWVALGIPISFLGGIWLMPVFDLSINMISLFAFIVVLGLAVDDAIVIGESIYTRMERKESGPKAATAGALRVSTPVVFAILTTVAAFAPLLYGTGAFGQIWRVIPLIVVPVLIFSLIESLFILPAHLAMLRSADGSVGNGVRSFWSRLQSRFDARVKWFIHDVYARFLEVALRWRYLTLACGVAVFLLTFALVGGGWIKFVFFPSVEGEDVVGLVTMPLGTPRERTEAAVHRLEEAAEQVRAEFEANGGDGVFRHVLSSIGEQPYRNRQHGPRASGGGFVGEHLGEVNIELSPAEDRTISSQEVAARWRELVGPIPDAVELTFSSKLFSSGEPINIELAARSTETLRLAAERAKAALGQYPGVFDITDSFRSGKEELKLAVKPEAEALGITQVDLARQVRQAFYGEEAQRIQRERDDVKVMVRFPEAERRSLGDLENMRIRGAGGTGVPFANVASVETGRGFSTIQRSERRRVISVTADVDLDRANPNEVVESFLANDLPEIVADYPGLTYSLEGEQREQGESLASLGRGYTVALFAIFALLAIPLRSYVQPLIVMSAIPFGFVGAVWGHILLGMNLTILSVAGFVALSGVVVNDSLIMVDFVNRARREGLSALQAARQAGTARFRAIFLTSVSTFAGVTPLLLERSLQAQFLKPLAVSLGYGVVFSTLVILVLVPSIYLILADVQGVVRRWLGLEEAAELAAGKDSL